MLRLFRRDAPRTVDTSIFEIDHAGERFSVSMKRVPGARRMTLRVRAAMRDVVMTVPPRQSLLSARDFAERHAAWIGARLRRLPQPVAFEPGAIIPLRGIDHLIAHTGVTRGTVAAELSAGGLAMLRVAGEAPHVPRRVLDFLKREARKDLEAAVRRYTGEVGVAAQRVTLRDTRSRWGSCSATGTLNFSWRLIMAPDYVLDYLAAHEVAHLVHLDHSPRFWELTHKLAPHTDRAEAWLKVHGSSLHRYGKSAVD